MDKLIREIYDDYKNGYEYMSYTYHDEEVGYDKYEISLENNNITILESFYDEENNLMQGSNRFCISDDMNYEYFERNIDSCIFYIPLEKVN